MAATPSRERINLASLEVYALNAANGKVAAAQAELRAVVGQVLTAHGLPQETRVMGLDGDKLEIER